MIRSILLLCFAVLISACQDMKVNAQEANAFTYSTDDVECMAQNIYFEASNQGRKGREAVAYVTLNRVESEQYPDNVCDVVKQAHLSKWHLENTGKIVPIRHKCQFSWYCDGKSDIIKDAKVYNDILLIAIEVMMRYPKQDVTFGATHYHANYVAPQWRKSLSKVIIIEDHIFYK